MTAVTRLTTCGFPGAAYPGFLPKAEAVVIAPPTGGAGLPWPRGGIEHERPRRPTIDELLADIIERVEDKPSRRQRERAATSAVEALITSESIAGRIAELEREASAERLQAETDWQTAKMVAHAAMVRIAQIREEQDDDDRTALLLLAIE